MFARVFYHCHSLDVIHILSAVAHTLCYHMITVSILSRVVCTSVVDMKAKGAMPRRSANN